MTQYTCQGVAEVVALGTQSYILIANTTELPSFNLTTEILNFYVDLTFLNELSNKTNG